MQRLSFKDIIHSIFRESDNIYHPDSTCSHRVWKAIEAEKGQQMYWKDKSVEKPFHIISLDFHGS